MSRSGRKVVYTEERVRALFSRMRSDLAAQHFAHLCELADVRKEVDAMRAELATLRELRATVLARQKAQDELTGLYRERSIQRARAAERDFSMPLQ